ncbi:MAG: KGK domain-containing protein [Calothrix sp. MO_167.B42]|nr:KGK domain-containing protein [Calothrix sp. MO_167.B42]
MEQIVKLNDDDVVSMREKFSPIKSPVFQVQQVVEEVVGNNGINVLDWSKNGVECEVIGSNTGGWKKGKVRFCLEFIPDQPAPEPEQAKNQESPLDDLRQQVVQIKKSHLP